MGWKERAAPKALAEGSVIAVIGSGAMGSGIAQVSAVAGYTVKLFDTRAGAVEKAIADIGKVFGKLVEKGKMSAEAAEGARARLHGVGSMADVADAALVVEAIVEDLEVKRKLFAELEGIVSDDCILATNTSSISVTSIGAKLRLPARLVGMHFFNPVPLMALVEVISGLATAPHVAAIVFATAKALGKHPVHAKSTPGFIVNRVARPYYAEALRVLSEQGADAATIDAIMRDCGGFRMGPFELMDLIGHDVNYSVTRSVHEAYYGDPRFTPSVVQLELVNAGFLGRKSGRGFYDYAEGAERPAATMVKGEFDIDRTLSISHGQYERHKVEALETRLRDSGFAIVKCTPKHMQDDAAAFHVNGAAVMLTDGRTATQRSVDIGHADVVLYDLLLDTEKAKRIAITWSDSCSPSAYLAAIRMFELAGFEVYRVDDVPGMVVMRTVAMLANEAADAVNNGVCTANDVDIAMKGGVNYPKGPLEWAQEIGVPVIVNVLDNLGQAYGDDRYRVSPFLRRKHANNRHVYA